MNNTKQPAAVTIALALIKKTLAEPQRQYYLAFRNNRPTSKRSAARRVRSS